MGCHHQQVEGLRGAGTTAFHSTLHGMRQIVASKGVRALFAGLSINYMKVVPTTAIGFTTYDALKQYLGLPQHL